MEANTQPAAPQNLPANAAPVPYRTPNQIMAKRPGGGWEIATRIETTNGPRIQFPDGSQWPPEGIEMGGAVSQAAPADVPNAPLGAAVQELTQRDKDLNAFRDDLVKLWERSHELFDLPLDVVIAMTMRHATNEGLKGQGEMGIHGGIANFTPNTSTFAVWLEAYTQEVRRRERAVGEPEL